MPNTKPNTDTADRVADKLARAHHRMWCDHAFYVGATSSNAESLKERLFEMERLAALRVASAGCANLAEQQAPGRARRSSVTAQLAADGVAHLVDKLGNA